MNEKQKKLATIIYKINPKVLGWIDENGNTLAGLIVKELTERNDLDIKFLEVKDE